MPKREDIKTILVIGSGPIVIGQACEFDYSGVQACKVLKEDGFRVVLVNSNPATIMTDPGLADPTYVELITPEFVEKVIAKERPDALLPTLGGQTALNTAVELAHAGVLDKYGVEMIGCDLDAIERGENRKGEKAPPFQSAPIIVCFARGMSSTAPRFAIFCCLFAINCLHISSMAPKIERFLITHACATCTASGHRKKAADPRDDREQRTNEWRKLWQRSALPACLTRARTSVIRPAVGTPR